MWVYVEDFPAKACQNSSTNERYPERYSFWSVFGHFVKPVAYTDFKSLVYVIADPSGDDSFLKTEVSNLGDMIVRPRLTRPSTQVLPVFYFPERRSAWRMSLPLVLTLSTAGA